MTQPTDDTGPDNNPGFFTWLRRTARLWGFLAFIFAILFVFRAVILPFILALLVAYVLAPIVSRLDRVKLAGRRLPRYVNVIVLYVCLAGLGTLFLTSFVPRVSQDFKRVIGEAPELWQRVKQDHAPRVADWIKANFGSDLALQLAAPDSATRSQKHVVTVEQLREGTFRVDLTEIDLRLEPTDSGGWQIRATPLPAAEQSLPEERPEKPQTIGDAIQAKLDGLISSSERGTRQVLLAGQALLAGLFSTFTTLLLVFMVSLFLLFDSHRILNWFRNLVPENYHADFDEVLRRIDWALSGAIRGQLLICLVNGLLTGVGLILIDVNYVFLLSLLAAVMSLIPIFGSILSTIPIVIVALVSSSTGIDIAKGALVMIWIGGIHLLEANLLNPKIIGKAARIHPVVVVFAVVAGERTYGVTGALLAVPIVSAVQAAFIYLRAKSLKQNLREDQILA